MADATATLRLHHHDLDTDTLLGRAIGVDRLPVKAIRGEGVTEVTVPAGTHILHFRNGAFFSEAVRYVAAPGAVLDFEVELHQSGVLGALFGGAVSMRRVPTPTPAERGGADIPLSRVLHVTVNP